MDHDQICHLRDLDRTRRDLLDQIEEAVAIYGSAELDPTVWEEYFGQAVGEEDWLESPERVCEEHGWECESGWDEQGVFRVVVSGERDEA